MEELRAEHAMLVAGGSVGDDWGVGTGEIPGRPLTSCERGIIGGMIAGAVGGWKGVVAGAIGGGVAGGCGN